MRKPKPDAFDVARAALESAALPRSQAEWRATSTALRRARALYREARRTCGLTLTVPAASTRRYLHLEMTYARGVAVYNGASPAGYLPYVRSARVRYAEGSRAGRVRDAESWARASRLAGPVPIPGAAE